MMWALWTLVTVFPSTLALPQRDIDLGNDLQCMDYQIYGYHCVPNFQCRADQNFTINTSGAKLIDVRLAERPLNIGHDDIIRSRCDKLLEVCCQTPESWNFNVRNFDSITTTARPELDCQIFDDCPDPDVQRPMCGVRNYKETPDQGLDKANQGEAEFGEWPHVCAILAKEATGTDNKRQYVYKCGASLLDDQVILTAAHCIHDLDLSTLYVRCGEWNTNNNDEPLQNQDREVQEVKLHPDFVLEKHHNNFAIVVVKQSFDRMDHIHPVCLPDPCFKFTDEFCVTGGWGKDQWGDKGRYATIQKEVVLPLMDDSTCQRELRKTRLGQFFELHSSFICAGGIKGVDTCQGDGGSPLTCRKPEGGGWFQAGIVSWGIGCNSEIPSVYANVAKATCWIDQQVTSYYGEIESHFGLQDICQGKEARCTGG